MILIISGTNKINSNTRFIANDYLNRLRLKHDKVTLLGLDEITFDFVSTGMYGNHSTTIKEIQNVHLNPATKFLFVIPEYNGSMPGILKLLIDSVDVRAAFNNKKAALVGVATGRAGNLRGLDHLAGVLQHMGVTVMPGSLPISKVGDILDIDGRVQGPTIKAIDKHIDNFLKF
jgi:chromate reductase, NAD(P)H dehydrogenase (quinone)